MPGKINASNISAPSLHALRAERQEGAKNNSFWDKWSNLSTGQKWGRALAWLIPPLGIGLQAGANLWQGRQAKAAAARPRETTLKQSSENVKGISLSSQAAYGSADRNRLKILIAGHQDIQKPILSIGSKGDSFKGLALAFEKDVTRDAEVHLTSSKGHGATINKDASEAGTVLRDFFKTEFQDSEGKAEPWALLTSKYANQSINLALNFLNTDVSGFRCTKGPADSQMRYALYMENDGNSALLEASISSDIDNIIDSQSKFVAKGDDHIDWEKSRMEETLLLRLKLGPPDSFEVISAHTKHNLVLKQPSENSEVVEYAPVKPAANEELITSSRASNLLQQFALGIIKPGGETYMPLQRYKDHLAAQDSPDLTAFKGAFRELDYPDQKQNLIGELVSVIKDKDPSSYSSQIEEGSELGQLLSVNLNKLKSQENLKDIQGMKNILNAAGIHSVNDLVKIDNRKNAADSITLDQEKIINNNFLGGGNILFKGFYDRPELLGEGLSTQERGDFYRPLLEAGDAQTLQIQLAEKQQMLDNGDINNDFFESYKINQQAVQDTTREERLGKDLDNLNAPEKRALLRKYITTAKSNNLTATEAMQVLRGLGAYHKADATEVKDQVSMVLSDQPPTKQQLENLKSLFPLMSS